MNVIICNQRKELLNNLNIDVIKTLEGQFDADEIINIVKNVLCINLCKIHL